MFVCEPWKCKLVSGRSFFFRGGNGRTIPLALVEHSLASVAVSWLTALLKTSHSAGVILVFGLKAVPSEMYSQQIPKLNAPAGEPRSRNENKTDSQQTVNRKCDAPAGGDVGKKVMLTGLMPLLCPYVPGKRNPLSHCEASSVRVDHLDLNTVLKRKVVYKRGRGDHLMKRECAHCASE